MGFRKRWNGLTSGNLTTVANWDPVNVRSSAWQWQASSVAGEYYLRTSAGANPGFGAAPASVQLDGVDAVSAAVGSLAAGQVGYGDNDSLGYSTIYARTADTADPDTKPVGYVTFRQLPLAGDHVTIPAGAGPINAGLSALFLALGNLIVEDGYLQAIGSSLTPLRLNTVTGFAFAGSGTSHIDLGATTADLQILKTAAPNTSGAFGLYLTGGAVGKLNLVRGNVAVAVRAGDVATITECRCVGIDATLVLGAGAAVTTVYQSDGSVVQRCNATNTNIEGGDFRSEEEAVITNLNILANDRPKRVYATLNSAGTVSTLNQKNSQSVVDLLQSGAPRTVTAANFEAGDLYWDPNTVTIGTLNTPTGGPFKLTAQAA
jgi:hypothetical protein